MATAKKKVVKKKVVKKKAAPAAPALRSQTAKLHVVLGDELMRNFEAKCETIGMSKSEVARTLLESFANSVIKITVPKVSQTKAIRK